jgi:hypothetical protein
MRGLGFRVSSYLHNRSPTPEKARATQGNENGLAKTTSDGGGTRRETNSYGHREDRGGIERREVTRRGIRELKVRWSGDEVTGAGMMVDEDDRRRDERRSKRPRATERVRHHD